MAGPMPDHILALCFIQSISFDLLDIPILLHKLYVLDIRSSIYNILKSFLVNKDFRSSVVTLQELRRYGWMEGFLRQYKRVYIS